MEPRDAMIMSRPPRATSRPHTHSALPGILALTWKGDAVIRGSLFNSLRAHIATSPDSVFRGTI
ncbi:hypothetical protein BJV74DRAFT_846022, partial [Russula compacta]